MRHVKLVECASILYGYPFDSSLFTEDDSYIPLIRIRDVMPGVASTYYTGEILSDYLIKAEDILVGMDGNFNLAKWKDRDGLLNQRTLKISAKDDLCINGYLYHLLGPIFKKIELNTAGGSVKHLSAKTINSIEIPLPPLSLQQEIVRILDSFTSMITNLETELASRQKQYEYYRNELLNFDKNDESIEWKSLGDLCTSISSGKSTSREIEGKYPVYGSTGIIAYSESYNYSIANILVARVGANAGYVHMAEGFYDVTDNTLVLSLKDQDLIDYIYYSLIDHNISQYAKGGGQPLVTGKDLKAIIIPIPPKQRRRKIVSTLDTFESLITNIKQELEARKKQYEYYREQLLTFE